MGNKLAFLATLLFVLSIYHGQLNPGVADPTPALQALADQINSAQDQWTASPYPFIIITDIVHLLRRLGAAVDSNPNAPAVSYRNVGTGGLPNIINFGRRLQSTNFPASLDLRTVYPACTTIKFIREQGQCGACWAFSSMNSISDRYCIANYNRGSPPLRTFSPQDVLECCANCAVSAGKPCDGGYFTKGFSYAVNPGVASGETYGNFKLCKPYFLSSDANTYDQPTCKSSCAKPSAYAILYRNDELQISGFKTGTGEAAMIAALNNGGSIVVTFEVFKDFYLYKSGVYSFSNGESVGLHAVRVIGYGVDSGVKYWLAANTWDAKWGESGFFRIKRGVNMCGIEAGTFAYAII